VEVIGDKWYGFDTTKEDENEIAEDIISKFWTVTTYMIR
jgi:hypothetical protein